MRSLLRAASSPVPPHRRPVVFWAAVLLAASVVGAGVLLAVRSYREHAGPEGAVRGYFAALAAADAPAALAYGDVPDGPHTLLTSPVLREQQRIAPISRAVITKVSRSGRSARVEVTYRVGTQPVSDTLGVHQAGDAWRLDTVAVATALRLAAAQHRATVVGAAVPTGDTLMFPGAVPVSFDTPYLQVRPADDLVTFGSTPMTLISVQVSAAGRQAVAAAVRASLDACYGPRASATMRCPQPSERYVPGQLRGATVSSMPDEISVAVQTDPDGLLLVTGSVQIQGTYRRLAFDNEVQTGSGTIMVPVQGSAYPIAPLRLTWARTA